MSTPARIESLMVRCGRCGKVRCNRYPAKMRHGPRVSLVLLQVVWGVLLAVGMGTYAASVANASVRDRVQQGEPGAASATRLRLPRGVSIELPDDWVILSKGQRITLNEWMKANADALHPLVEGSELSFAANWLDAQDGVLAVMNLRYYPDAADNPDAMTQEHLKDLSAADLREVDEVMRSETVKAVSAINMTMVKWGGARRVNFGDLAVLEREYVRALADGSEAFRVRMQRVPLGEQTFTITVSYRIDAEPVVGPVCDQILKSLQVARYAASPRSKEPVVKEAKPVGKTVRYTPEQLEVGVPWNPALAIGIGLFIACMFAVAIGVRLGAKKSQSSTAELTVRGMRVFVRRCVLTIAVAVAGVASVWGSELIGHDWRESEWKYDEGLVVRRYRGASPALEEVKLDGYVLGLPPRPQPYRYNWYQSDKRPSPAVRYAREIVDDQIERSRAQLAGQFQQDPLEPVFMEVMDGRITYVCPDASSKINDGEVGHRHESPREAPRTLFVREGAQSPADIEAIEAAEEFWRQRQAIVNGRELQRQLDQIQLADLDAESQVRLLSSYVGMPEDVVWRNRDEAIRLAKLMAYKVSCRDEGGKLVMRISPARELVMGDLEALVRREWGETMYPRRVLWEIVGPLAFIVVMLVACISYLAAWLTRAHRRLPSMGN
jgi:hypothetical protein